MDAVRFKAEVFCWKNLLYRLALRLLNNAPEAEDAVQHIMMKMWQKRDELDDIENLKGFVIRALQNDCLNRLKKEQTIVQHHGQFAKTQSLSTEVSQGNMVELIKGAINKLPEKQRITIHLCDVEGFDTKEIADILDIDEGAVRTNLSRARQKIKMQIIKLQEYEERKV
ncbi:RNA polymerase sigma factor [Paradesertivirga mongoliensis]|uniref:RNA polymerase sigma factor n=1 Tax=Paradesertivirga mongoliensis TaxID=2100740 RepID=A0ABW4ZQU5_9SPHI|nr:RNA polymerase sigma factor [Pedobacter mongoliensis]